MMTSSTTSNADCSVVANSDTFFGLSPKKVVKKLISFGFVPIPLKYNEKRPLKKEWQKTTLETALKGFSYVSKYNIGVVCGKISNLTVIDVDIHKDGVAHKPTLEWFKKNENLLNQTVYVKTTSNNYHFYFKFNKNLPTRDLRTFGINVEIKSNGVQVVAPNSKVKKGVYKWVKSPTNKNDIKIIPVELEKLLSLLVKAKNNEEKNVGDTVSLDNIPDFLKDEPITRINTKNEFIYYDLDKSEYARTDPKSGEIYKSNNCYFMTDTMTGITFHCVHNGVNKVIYNDDDSIIDNIKECLGDSEMLDDEVSNIVIRAINGNISYCSNNKMWYNLNHKSGLLECSDIPSCLTKYYKKIRKKLNDLMFFRKYDEDTKIVIKKIKNCLGKINYVLRVEKWLKRLINNPRMEEQIDMKRHLIGFNNGVYDVNKCEFRKGTLKDMVSMTTGYNYTPIRDEKIKAEINDFMTKIYPIPELKCYMLMVLGSTFQGLNKDNILPICDGWGGNGKSVLKDLLIRTLGDYATELSASYLAKADNVGAGADAGLYDSVKRLMLFFSEPSGLDAGTIKKLTGGDRIKVRTLYQKKPITLIPKFTTIIMLNKCADLQINDTSNGTERRIRVIPHLSRFVDKPSGKYEFLKDTFITDKFDKWKMELFHILLDQFTQYKKVTKENQGIMINYPDIVGEHSKRFLNSDNAYKDFVSAQVEKGDDKILDKISMKDIWKCFIQWWSIHSNEYSLNKPVKAVLKNTVESSLKILFKARSRVYKDGNTKFCSNVLIGYKLKEVDESDNYLFVEDIDLDKPAPTTPKVVVEPTKEVDELDQGIDEDKDIDEYQSIDDEQVLNFLKNDFKLEFED